MAQLSLPPTPDDCQELSQLQERYRAELMRHASMKTSILDNSDLACQTRNRNMRIRRENARMQKMIKDLVMGLQPHDAGSYEMPEDDSAVFVNFIADVVSGLLQEDDSLALELAHIATMPQQPMPWASLARQDAVREGSHGAASRYLGYDPVDGMSPTCAPDWYKEGNIMLESRVPCSGGAYQQAEQQLGRQPTMVPQPKGSSIILQTTLTPKSELQQTQSSLPQKDTEGDAKSTNKKIGRNDLQRKGTMVPFATPFTVGRISSPTSSLQPSLPQKVVGGDAKSTSKKIGSNGLQRKGTMKHVATPFPVGRISSPTSSLPVEVKPDVRSQPAPLLSATPLARLKDPLPVVPLPAQSTAWSSGVRPEISSALVPLEPDRGSLSSVYADQQISETLASSLGDISGDITTVVIQHIPGQILQSDLMQRWPASDIGYNMLYAPYNQRKRHSMGFAFMNFTTHSALLEFHRSWHGVVLRDGPDSKGLSISAADVQGLEANIQLMVGSKLVKSMKRTRHLPMIVEVDGNFADFRKLLTRGSPKGLDNVKEEEEPDGTMEEKHNENMAGTSGAPTGRIVSA